MANSLKLLGPSETPPSPCLIMGRCMPSADDDHVSCMDIVDPEELVKCVMAQESDNALATKQ